MKILVPTDFSDLATVAVKYAAGLASATRNPMILMNNYTLENLPRAGVLINIEEKGELNAMDDLQALSGKISSSVDPSPDIFCELTRSGNDAKAILQKAVDSDAGLIVMGTNGASGLTGALLGSVSDQVIRESTIPVIVVPCDSRFSMEGSIVFAVSLNTIPPDSTIRYFHAVCSLFKKTPEYFFADAENMESDIEEFKNKVESLFPGSKPVFHISPENDPVTAINKYINTNTCLMLALAPGIHSLFNRIMGKSVTTKLIAQSTIPVLILP